MPLPNPKGGHSPCKMQTARTEKSLICTACNITLDYTSGLAPRDESINLTTIPPPRRGPAPTQPNPTLHGNLRTSEASRSPGGPSEFNNNPLNFRRISAQP